MRKVLVLALSLALLLGLALPASAAPAPLTQGVVTDGLGRPVAGAEVEVYRLGQGLVSVGQTSAIGAFRLDAKPEAGALWQLRVAAKGYRTLDTGWVDLGRNPYQALRLEPLQGALRVTAVDRNGEPVLAQMLVLGPGGRVVIDTLDGDGLLELAGLMPGQYRVLVQSGATAPWASTVSVTAGATASATALLLPATIAVAGEVRDARTGLPVASASVQLLREDGTYISDMPADGGGRFRIGIGTGEAGAVKVQVWAEGYRPYTSPVVTLAGGQEQDFSGKNAVLLEPSATVVAGTVLKESGEARPGTQVVLEAKSYGWIATAAADSAGNFRFEQVPADPSLQYRVFVAAETEAASTGWMALADGVTDQLVLQTVARGVQEGAYGQLSGAVLSASGRPLAGATVELLRRGKLIKTVETDSAGRFLAKDLPGTKGLYQAYEPYTLKVSKPGYLTTSQFVTGGQEALEIHIGGNSRPTVRVTLQADRTELRGRVVGNRGEAVANAELYLMAGPFTTLGEMVRTDSQGWYSFKDVPVTPGVKYAIRGKANGYLQFDGFPVAPAGVEQQTLATVRLTAREALFAGQVLGADGQPVPGASVTARGLQGTVVGQAKADANGFYRLKATLPATGAGLTLLAGLPGYTPSALELTEKVEPGSTQGRDLVVLPATAVLAGQVLTPDGAPVAGAKVELMQEGRGLVAAQTANQDGTYRFDEVAADGSGWFWLRVRPETGVFAGSLRHQTDLVPLLQPAPGQMVVTDLLVK